MTIRLEAKRPDEVRNYRHDWAPFLGADTIQSQTTTITGATLDSTTVEAGNQSVVFVVSGGTESEPARIEQHIVTAAGLAESETFILPITGAEVITTAQAKDYLRVKSSSEDAKICAMIPRARLWVEDHVDLALVRRQFTERRRTEAGAIRLFKGPLVSVDSVTYGDALTYTPRSFPPDTRLVAATDSAWPVLDADDAFEITYTAGFAVEEIDDRLIGAMYALIEGEYSEGYAYPDRAIAAAERCCGYLRVPVL